MRKLYKSSIFLSLAFLLLGLFSFNQQIYSQIVNSGFETGSTTGWTGTSNTTASAGITVLSWTVNPAGSYMGKIMPAPGIMKANAEANLGLTSGALTTFNSGLFNTSTNFGTMSQSIYLNAGQTFVMHWNYISQDYSPFNDGVIATLVGPAYQQIQLLAVTSNAWGNTQAIQTGSFGSTDWHTVTFTAGAAGYYTLGFACFNTGDQIVDPIFLIDNGPGGTSAPGTPIVFTSPVTLSGATSAITGGNVSSDGGSPVTARGVCWGTSSIPTIANSHTIDGSGTGTFTSNISGLTAGGTYYFRAYASNVVGTVYGSEVTLVMGEAPVISCPSNISVNSSAGLCGANVNFSGASATGMPTPTITYAPASGSFFSIGNTSVTATATNSFGSSSCTFNVNVTDNILPTVIAQNASVYLSSTGSATINASQINNGSYDNCSIASITVSPSSFTCANIGANSVVLTVTDNAGNVSSTTATVTVIDGIFPTLSSPANVVKNSDAGTCGSVVNYNLPVITDNCLSCTAPTSLPNYSFLGVIAGHTYFRSNFGAYWTTADAACVALGGHLATITSAAENTLVVGNGGQAWIGFTDQVSEGSYAWVTGEPVGYTSWAPGEPNNAGNEDYTVTNWGANGKWNDLSNYYSIPFIIEFDCAAALPTQTSGLPSGSVFPVGTTTNTFTYTDASNNTTTSSFTVTVNDIQVPTVIAQNVSTYLDANGNASISASQINNGSFDNCGIASITVAPSTFTCSNVGANTVTLTVTDIHGNVNSATATVTVVDAIIPTVLTQNQTIYLDANGQASITVAMINNASFDNCGISTLTLDNMNFNCSNVGANTVTLTATDVNGNVNSATATVTVQDNIAPTVIGCPSNITVNNLANNCFQTVLYTPPSFTDACGISTVTAVNNAGVICYQSICCADKVQGAFPVGVTTVTYTATDVNGNVSTCTFTITVVDSQPPTINNCPANITLNVDPGTCQKQFVYWTPPTPSDNCPSWSMTASHFPGQTFAVGTTTVSYTLSDNAGHTVVCSFDVTIIDNEAPIAICKAATINLDANGVGSITANDINDGSTDNCGIQSITLSKYAFDCANVGANTVTMTVLDIHGNTSTCQATVNVVDNISPMVITQNTTVNLGANGQASITTADVNNGTFDNCSFTLSVAPSTFNCSNTGANTVTLTATDASGNVSSATSVVTVIDNISPTMATQNITVYLDANGAASITTGDIDNGTFDNCSFTLSVSPSTFNCSNTGANTVSLTATDASGNISSATAIVTVIDNISPTVITQNQSIYLDANGQASITTNDINNGSFDNCAISSMSLSQSAFDCSILGANNVTLTVIDASNNVGAANAIVTVIDNINPQISGCPSNITVNALSATCSNVANWVAPTASDNCSIASLISNYNSGDVFPLGTTTVNYVATDISGNTSSCSFTVTVVATPLVISHVTSIYNGNNISCNGASDGSIDVTLTGGCLPYSYSWSNGASSEDLSGIAAGTYNLTATDANGASISLSVILTEPDVLASSISSNTYIGGWNISCNGKSDGNSDLNVTGGTTPYTFVWSNGSTSEDLNNLTAGTYSVTISDANGCSTSSSITLTEPDAINSTIEAFSYNGGNNISCKGASDGSIDLTAQGGTAPFMFAWSNGATSEDVNQLTAGNYSVIITDANNCQTTQSITLYEPSILVANAGVTATICQGASTQLGGSPTTNGGTAPYTYAWSPSSSLDFSNVSNPVASPMTTTTYSLNTYDDNGCMAMSTVIVNVNTLPTVSISTSTPDNFCKNVALTAVSSTAISYNWSNGFGTQTITLSSDVNAAGIYSVNVTDANGCTSNPGANYNYQPENLANSYTIIGFKDMNLGERNYVDNGSVGLTDAGRKAKVMKYAEIDGPNAFLKADNIDAKAGSIVPIKIYDPANVTLPTMHYYTASTITGTLTVANNSTTTISANNKNIKIGKNCNVTLTANNFGNIEMDQSSKINFTAADINIIKLSTKKATLSNKSEINFAQNAKVKVSKEVRIEEYCMVNGSYEYNVVFYIGEECVGNDDNDDHKDGGDDDENEDNHNSLQKSSSSGDDGDCYNYENGNDGHDGNDGNDDDDDEGESSCSKNKGIFHVHANGVTFNASVMVPRGHIHVHKSASSVSHAYMNGLFIADDFKSEGNYVHWNWNSCGSTIILPTLAKTANVDNTISNEASMKVYPNPANQTAIVEFNIPSDGNVVVEVYNMVGQRINTIFDKAAMGSQTYKLKVNVLDYNMGVYYIKLTNGTQAITQRVVFIK